MKSHTIKTIVNYFFLLLTIASCIAVVGSFFSTKEDHSIFTALVILFSISIIWGFFGILCHILSMQDFLDQDLENTNAKLDEIIKLLKEKNQKLNESHKE